LILAIVVNVDGMRPSLVADKRASHVEDISRADQG